MEPPKGEHIYIYIYIFLYLDTSIPLFLLQDLFY